MNVFTTISLGLLILFMVGDAVAKCERKKNGDTCDDGPDCCSWKCKNGICIYEATGHGDSSNVNTAVKMLEETFKEEWWWDHPLWLCINICECLCLSLCVLVCECVSVYVYERVFWLTAYESVSVCLFFSLSICLSSSVFLFVGDWVVVLTFEIWVNVFPIFVVVILVLILYFSSTLCVSLIEAIAFTQCVCVGEFLSVSVFLCVCLYFWVAPPLSSFVNIWDWLISVWLFLNL